MRNKKRKIKHNKSELEDQSITLDIHGFRYKDAEDIILKHIDDIYFSNLHYVRIIHGHGEGTLKSLVRKIMKESSKISNYYSIEGDAVTVGEVVISD
ncbi:MAG: hypothetical protein CL748_06585 [Chloroflexi bacterium]|nr:hypothetical protein [Chloroflexota bacterium]